MCRTPMSPAASSMTSERAFVIIEFLSTPESPGEYLSEIFRNLELVVAARFPVHHSCCNRTP